MLLAGLVALTLGAMADPGNTLVAVLAFLSWTLVLTPAVIHLFGKVIPFPGGAPSPEAQRAEFKACLRAGREMMREGQFEEAVAWFESAGQASPGQLAVALLSAEALRRAGELGSALERLDEAEALHAGEPAFHFARARYACLAENFARARSELQRAADTGPEWLSKALDEPDFLWLRGWIARQAGGSEGAQDAPGPSERG